MPPDSDPEEFDTAELPPYVLNAIEADSFWCLSRLLDGIQDNYIAGQPGIQRSVKRMTELVARIDRQYTCCVGGCIRTDKIRYSTSCGASRRRERRVHAIRVPLDELPPHARDQRGEHNTNVGHLSGTQLFTCSTCMCAVR